MTVGGCSRPTRTLQRGRGVSRWRRLVAPGAAWVTFGLALGAQAWLSSVWPTAWQVQTDLGAPPEARWLELASLGDYPAAAYGMLLYVQTFDSQAGASVRVRTLNHGQLRAWLERATDVYPAAGYPFLLAVRIYASAASTDDSRALLDMVEQRFREAPNQRWPWLAHAVWVARYELHDMARAAYYAQSLRLRATAPEVPAWARQLELFVLAADNKLEAAHRLLDGLIRSGQIRDAAELRVLLRGLGRPMGDEPPIEADGRSAGEGVVTR